MRQYIGARYVPKFMGTYDNTQAYEALCVVDNGMGTSYISTIPVPPNTPLTDTNYWAIYGASSGAVINLQNQIDTINNTTIPNINNEIGTLASLNTTDKSSLVNAINETLAETVYPNMKLANTPDRKILFLGDSYAGVVDGNGQNYVNIAAGILGCAYTEVRHPGIGFTNINSMGTFLEYLQTVVADRDSYTDIVVCGGCNDYSSVAATETAIKQFCDYCFANFPNAKVTIAHIGGFATKALQSSQIKTKSLPAYRSCSKYGAYYMKNSEYIMYSPSVFESDNVHPKASHVAVIGEKVAQGILDGYCDIELFTGQQPTSTGDPLFTLSTSYLPAINTWIHNNRIGLQGSGYMICRLASISASAYNNTVFEHKIFGSIPYFGFASNWNSGQYAMCVRVYDPTNHVNEMGLLYLNTDETMSLLTSIAGNPAVLEIYALGEIDTEFDITR